MRTDITRRSFVGGIAVLPALAFAQRTSEAPASGDVAWKVHTEVPPNREVPLSDLVEEWITPVNRFYVRSHAQIF